MNNISKFNQTLKEESERFKTFRNDDHITSIRCKYGIIQPYSIDLQTLLFAGDFPSGKAKAGVINNLPEFCEVTQEGDWGFVCKFPRSRLEDVKKSFKISTKRAKIVKR